MSRAHGTAVGGVTQLSISSLIRPRAKEIGKGRRQQRLIAGTVVPHPGNGTEPVQARACDLRARCKLVASRRRCLGRVQNEAKFMFYVWFSLIFE